MDGTHAVYGKFNDVIDRIVIKKARANDCSTAFGDKLLLFFNDRLNVNPKILDINDGQVAKMELSYILTLFSMGNIRC